MLLLEYAHRVSGPRASYAAAFSPPLLNPDKATPPTVAGPSGKAALKRYNVYRNNVTVSLIDALAAVYPAVQRITGVEFFRAMARSHIRATPPNSPLLFEYGREFPVFIERYEYARSMPWLADIARIERAHKWRPPPWPRFRLNNWRTLFSCRTRRRGSFARTSRR
jgi:Putative DNA-binding domain